jgi:broad specificity phosphatase PhoE
MTTVYLVRHGEVLNPDHVVYGDLPGFNLSSAGRAEASAAGVRLENVPIDKILSSPLARAVQTAEAIAQHHHNVSVLEDEGIGEARMYPEWIGHRWDDIPELFPGQLEQYLTDASMSTGTHESLAHVANRMRSAIDDVLDTGVSHVVVVSHQDPIQAFRLAATGRPLSELRLDPPSHGSITTLERTNVTWAETGHWQPDT